MIRILLVDDHPVVRYGIRQILVDGVAWYWHAMGILWLFLFALLAFFQ